MWVPQAARAVCYSCGTKFSGPAEKTNCYLCFDVFCHRCMLTKRLLPVHYGYTDPQPVCNTCNLLLTSFVRFAAQVHKRGAGILLPPREAVIIASCNLPKSVQVGVGGAHGSNVTLPLSDETGGWFSRFVRRVRGEEAPSLEASGSSSTADRRAACPHATTDASDAPQIASCCNIPPSELASRGVQVRDACSLFMVGWRPLNVSTAIVVGHDSEVRLFLKDIVRVSVGNSLSGQQNPNKRASVSPSSSVAQASPSPSASAAKHRHTVMLTSSSASGNKGNEESPFNDGRVTVELRGGYFCQLLVGQVETAPRRSSTSIRGGAEDDDTEDEVDTIEDFTSDPSAAQQLADRLSTLVRHVKQHFALSQASLALHADLCPS